MKLATVLFLSLSVSLAFSQWTSGPAYPGGATDGCYSFTIGNRIFVGGGLVAHRLYEYKSDNTWSEVAKPPAGGERSWSFAFTIGEKAYVCGGANGGPSNLMKDLWEYDPAADKWTQKADMPVPRDGGFAFSVGGKGYIGCGFDGGAIVGNMYSYDPVEDKWQELNMFPDGVRLFASAFVIDGKAYVVGGDAGGYESVGLFRYEPSEDSWTTLADFPGDSRQAGVAFTLNNEGYYCGGMHNYEVAYRDMWKYNPVSNEWSKLNTEMPSEYTAWQTATINSTYATTESPWALIVTGAGFNDQQLLMTNRTDRFTPATADVISLPVTKPAMIYPNPVQRGSAFSLGNTPAEYSITDALGRIVMQGKSEGSAISASSLTAGSYSISFQWQDAKRTATRFIVQ